MLVLSKSSIASSISKNKNLPPAMGREALMRPEVPPKLIAMQSTLCQLTSASRLTLRNDSGYWVSQNVIPTYVHPNSSRGNFNWLPSSTGSSVAPAPLCRLMPDYFPLSLLLMCCCNYLQKQDDVKTNKNTMA